MAAVRTARQKAALRKAQLASARKRRGKGKSKNRKRNIRRRVALVAATGGLAGLVGASGVYYARKLGKGGPKAPKASKVNHSTRSTASTRRRGGPPRSDSLDAVGYAFLFNANYKAYKANKTIKALGL